MNIYETFMKVKDAGDMFETLSLCGLLIDYVSVKYGVEREDLLERFVAINNMVNKKLGEMKVSNR